MSSSNLVSLIYVPEVTYGSTPVDDAGWKTVRMTDEDINAEVSVNQSSEIRADRMVSDQFKTEINTLGGFGFEFSADSFDDFLEGVLNAANVGGVYKIGSEDISFSIEKNFTDLTANHFLIYRGMRVDSMNLSFARGEPLNGRFVFAGAGYGSASASEVGLGSVAAATTTRIMNSVSDLTTIEVDDTAFTGCIQSIDLNIDNSLRARGCLGSDTPQNQELGTSVVSGNITAYLTDTTIQWYTDKVINQADFSIDFIMTDGVNNYHIDIPKARIAAPSPNAPGLDTDVMISADFNALLSPADSSNIVITKT